MLKIKKERKTKTVKKLNAIDDIEDIVPMSKSQVISASRRTDIPAFYMDRMIEAMKNKSIDVTDRYGKTTRISLSPNDVKCFSWWSKDYAKWIKMYSEHKKLFSNYSHMFNFTITGSDDLESGVASSLNDRLDQVKVLVDLFGATAVKIRFDPIVTYIDMKTNEQKNNLGNYKKIIKSISAVGISEVVIAFCLPYKKVVSRMKNRGKILVELSEKDKHKILDDMIKIADKYNVTISACCSSAIVGYKNKIIASKCIDGDAVEKIIGEKLDHNTKDKGQRDECKCVKSRDIGEYTMVCKHSCDYCYANPSE